MRMCGFRGFCYATHGGGGREKDLYRGAETLLFMDYKLVYLFHI
jgi:hypothetical protein